MSAWLDPLRAALERASQPVSFFIRDDDAGWADDQLYRLLETFERRAIPLDLAVIPYSLSKELSPSLLSRTRNGTLDLHMHGCRHVNHEPVGRKCEFGPSRSRMEQSRDLQAGKCRLEDLFGEAVDPIFTPPWNRCTQITADCLAELGYRVLSRDQTAVPLELTELRELPITVDLLRKRHGVRVGLADHGRGLARAADGRSPVGIMLHHAGIAEGDLRALEQLLALLQGHRNARIEPMLDLAYGRPDDDARDDAARAPRSDQIA